MKTLITLLALGIFLSTGLCFAQTPGSLNWWISFGDYEIFQPAFLPDGVMVCPEDSVFATSSRKIYLIRPDSSIKRTLLLPIDFFTSEAVIADDSTIYVVAKDLGLLTLWALDKSGHIKWNYDLGYDDDTAPALGSDGTIYITNYFLGYCEFTALNPDGSVKWEYFSWDKMQYPSVSFDGTIYVCSNEKKLYAFNSDGTLKWTSDVRGIKSHQPSIGPDGTVFVVSTSDDGVIQAFRASDGSLKWEFNTGSGTYLNQPVIGNDYTIYVGTSNALYALNRNGVKEWEFPISFVGFTTPAIGGDGTIYIVGSLTLYAFNPDGSLKWKYLIDLPTGSPVIGPDGTIYINPVFVVTKPPANRGYLFSIYSDSPGLAHSSWPMYHRDSRHTGRVDITPIPCEGSMLMLALFLLLSFLILNLLASRSS